MVPSAHCAFWEKIMSTDASAEATRPIPLSAATLLADVTLLNRAVYGGDDDLLPQFRDDYQPARDPDNVGTRSALNVYDRYDLYLKQFGFRTLSSAELGFTAAQVSASETSDGLYKNFTYAGDLIGTISRSSPTERWCPSPMRARWP